MKWFKDYTDYEKLWTLGDIGIEDVPDDALYNCHKRGGFDFWRACQGQMKARREARGNQ